MDGSEPDCDALAEVLADTDETLLDHRALCARLGGWADKRLDVAIRELRALGAPLAIGPGGLGFQKFDSLDREWLESRLDMGLRVVRVCTSTNKLAWHWRGPLPLLCLCEAQTLGRGRRGRLWKQSYGSGLALSLAVRSRPEDQGPIALALAVALAQMLRALGYGDVGLKWPNDFYARDAKLGGLLVLAESGAGSRLVVGLGLNVHHAPHVPGRKTIALAELMSGPRRNPLAVQCLEALVDGLDLYRSKGFNAFSSAWQTQDVLRGKVVEVEAGQRSRISGIACGIDEQGALKIQSSGGMRRLLSGEVTLGAWTGG